MRVVIDGRLYGLEHRGIGRYLVHLVSELGKIKTQDKFVLLLRRNYFKRLKLPKNWSKVLANFGVYGFEEQIKLPVVLNKIKPDLVHFPHFNVPILWRGRFVVTIHDMTMHAEKWHASQLPLMAFYLKKYAYKHVFSSAIRKSSKIITPSEVVASEIQQRFKVPKKKIEAVYEGYDPGVWTGKHPLDVLRGSELASGDYFVYVGSLFPHKNIATVVRALAIFNRHADKPVNLAIVGAKNLFLKPLLETISKEGMNEHVLVMGFVKDTDISTILKNSLGLIYPSLSEGFGLQGLEAMSSGTLVLASDIPTFREVYADNAFYFDPKDPLNVAKTMHTVVKLTKKNREANIKKAGKFITRYSWNKMAKKTLAIYHETAKKSQSYAKGQ